MDKSKISSNLIYNLVYQVLVIIIPLITSPYISRVLGAEKLGTFSYIHSVATYFYIFVNLGLVHYGNRAIARVREDKKARSREFWSIQFMHMLIGIPICILYVIFSLNASTDEYRFLFLIYGFYVLSAVFDVSWYFFGMSNFKVTTYLNAFIRVTTFISILLFVKNKEDISVYIFLVGFSSFLGSFLLFLCLKDQIYYVKPNFKSVLSHICPNIILFFPILAISIYRVMDKIMITWFRGEIETGYYQNADAILTISMTGFSALAAVMVPEISALAAKSEYDTIKRSIQYVMEIGLCLSFAITFGLAAIGEKFAPIFWGPEFVSSGILIVGLSVVPIISEWKNVLRSQYLIPCGKDKGYAVSLMLGASVNIILNLILIPLYGALGAVFGTIMAELVGAIYQTFIVHKELPIFSYIKDNFIFIIPGLLMFWAVRSTNPIFPNDIFGIFYGILVGVIVYFASTAFVLFFFYKKRFLFYVQFIKRKK